MQYRETQQYREMSLSWTDHYLQWNTSEYPGVQTVRFPDGQIWKPDILLYNSADERFDATFHTNVLVNSSGHCQYLPPGIFKSSCYIDVRWFPFDVQQCKLKFGSWSYGGWSLDLQMQEADISGYIPNGEWDLIGIPGKRSERFYECCKEPYPDVTFTVTIRRRTLYYGLNLLIPCVLISALALLVFLLPADSGEKISLGITVLLSLTVFMLLVAEIMPATSDSVPLIAQYFASTMIIVGLSVVVTVIVLQYHHHDPDGGQMPKWVRSSRPPLRPTGPSLKGATVCGRDEGTAERGGIMWRWHSRRQNRGLTGGPPAQGDTCGEHPFPSETLLPGKLMARATELNPDLAGGIALA
ncbi:PREDICTED: neuronal acetylcholine receptor subunit alpha-7 [Myotis davidii]|uniref:neuronal acetylcholine receptor subunit alpha-7 n=1 Tax=Myotis davidii TaxID=225400 RepID=UPI000766FD10|nr:PREDICTED: neuronal acetylcholine receptor subunit alpha-7 [Myotis davidii]